MTTESKLIIVDIEVYDWLLLAKASFFDRRKSFSITGDRTRMTAVKIAFETTVPYLTRLLS